MVDEHGTLNSGTHGPDGENKAVNPQEANVGTAPPTPSITLSNDKVCKFNKDVFLSAKEGLRIKKIANQGTPLSITIIGKGKNQQKKLDIADPGKRVDNQFNQKIALIGIYYPELQNLDFENELTLKDIQKLYAPIEELDPLESKVEKEAEEAE